MSDRTEKSPSRRVSSLLAFRIVRIGAMLTQSKFTAGSTILVEGSPGEFLFISKRFIDRGKYGLPGGYRKRSEDFEQAALRELMEETGLAVALNQLRLTAIFRQSWSSHIDVLYSVAIGHSEAVRAGSDVAAVCWRRLDEIEPTQLTRGAWVAIEMARGGSVSAFERGEPEM